MRFLTPRSCFIFLGLILSCGGNGTSSGGTVETPVDQGGAFEGPGSSGPFAANAGAASDVIAKYGSGGPFESQGASGPFAKPGGCAAACQRVASFVCPPVEQQQQTPGGSPGASSSSSNSTSLDDCLHSCANLDAVQSSCIRSVLDPYIACYLTATLSCDRNGQVRAEGCPQLELSQLTQCGVTVTQTTPQPGNDNGTGGGTPVTRVDAGVR